MLNSSFKLTLTLLKRSGKETIFFIAILSLTSTLIFNFTNLTLLPQVKTDSSFDNFLISYLIILTLAVSFFVLYNANNYLNKLKGCELALQILSGASPYKIGFLLTIQVTILNLIGCSIGILLGIFTTPFSIYYLTGIFNFSISSTTFIYIISFTLLQSFALGLINQGFGYRNDIKTLVDIDSKSTFVSTRYKKELKFNHYICFPLILSAFLIFLLPADILKEVSLFFFILPLIGCKIFYNTFLPLYIDKKKKTSYLNNKVKLIGLSNLKTSLEKNKFIFYSLLVIGILSPALASFTINNNILTSLNTLSFLFCILFITFMMIFFGLSSGLDESKVLKNLLVLGFTKKDLLKIIKFKTFSLYGILLILPLFFTLIYISFQVLFLDFSVKFALIFLCSYILLFTLSALVTYKINIKLL